MDNGIIQFRCRVAPPPRFVDESSSRGVDDIIRIRHQCIDGFSPAHTDQSVIFLIYFIQRSVFFKYNDRVFVFAKYVCIMHFKTF